jgi:superfamily II DNA helicase RecQ
MRTVFGVEHLRAGQEEVILRPDRADTLAVMPAGLGKSFCYPLPTLNLRGTTVPVAGSDLGW